MDFNKILHSLAENLLTPIPLCFALGIFCKLIHGGIKIPKELYYTISIFLLMSIGFIGGHELAKEVKEHGLTTIWQPALVTFLLGCVTPITASVVLRYVGRMSVPDSAGIAAHYGSTSAVTYAVADVFANQAGTSQQLPAHAGNNLNAPASPSRWLWGPFCRSNRTATRMFTPRATPSKERMKASCGKHCTRSSPASRSCSWAACS